MADEVKVRLVNSPRFLGFLLSGSKAEKRREKRARLRTILKPPVSLPELPDKSHRLHDAVFMLRVAHEKLHDLERSIKSALESKLNTVRFEDEPDGLHKTIRLVVGQPPDEMWSVTVKEIAGHLHSVLDMSIVGLTVRRKNRPRHAAFPILTHRTKNGKPALTKNHGVECLPAAYMTVIERAQPYQAGNLRWKHPLWLLMNLNNTVKHRRVVGASTSVSGGGYTFLRLPSHLTQGIQFHAGVPFENGAILGRVPRDVQVKPNYSVAVRFTDACPAVAGEEAISALRSMEEEVCKIVAAFLSVG